MSKLKLIKLHEDHSSLVIHTLAIPRCCPVSGNPQPGSHISILYRARGHALDVLSLPAYIRSYVGGLRGQGDQVIVRNMEDMIQRIAQDAAEILGTTVRVQADLQIAPEQRMIVRAKAYTTK